MSYLDLPRFHLSGQFFANPSTINNEAPNYDPSQPLSTISPQLPGAVGWNPLGQALWTMSMGVQTVLGADGTAVTTGDALAGATLASVDLPFKGKLVDLDPQQQSVSQVWGVTVALTLADTAKTQAFTGTVLECALTDVWGRLSGGSAGGIASASGQFQTVIQVTQWAPDLSSSPITQALQELAQANGNLLSLKWVVDGYNGAFGTAGFGLGRMVATVGPYLDGEPYHVVSQRRLEPAGGPMSFAPFKLDSTRNVLVLDLGNSVGTSGNTAQAGFALSSLQVQLDSFGTQQTLPTTLTYDLTTYAAQAGIYEVPLTPEQTQLAETTAVMVMGSGAAVQERFNGLYVAPDVQLTSTRLSQGESTTVSFLARQFGAPLTGYELDFQLTPITNSDTTMDPPVVGSEPPAGISFPPTAVTGDDGVAVLTLTGGDVTPKPAYRDDVDGQVYHIVGSWWASGLFAGGLPAISVLVFEPYAPQTTPPTWWGDIQPMMYAYARMYPGMREIMDISDYGTLMKTPPGMTQTGAQLVQQALTLPLQHPNHMPVTRDLSPARVQAFVDWAAAGYPLGTPPAGAETPAAATPVTASQAERFPTGSVKSALVEP